MKPEEALKRLETIFTFGISNTWKDKEAKEMTIQALEKQVPKKPILCGENPDGTYQFRCSDCGRLWWEKSYITKYCDGCGNATDRGADV